VSVAAEHCRRHLEAARGVRWVEASVLAQLAYLDAMAGDFESAWEQWRRSRAVLEELGMMVALAARATQPAAIAMMAGDPEAAERELRHGYDALEEIGERELRSTNAGALAHALYEQRRDDEALELSQISEDLAAADDVWSQSLWRAARAKVLARRDRDPLAEELAVEAVRLAATTDFLSGHGSALLDLAEVLAALGRPDEAAARIEEALALFEAKEDAASITRAERLREGLPVAG
jgi:tetratricopeptide (TPR) repeat protein